MNSAVYSCIFVKIIISLFIVYIYLRHSRKQPVQFSKKRVEIICGLFLLTFFLLGCLPSLHPLYTEDTLVFDEQLIGKWSGDDKSVWIFTKSGEKKYELRVMGKEGKQAWLEAHLVELGASRFLDLFPAEEEVFPYTQMAVHTFMKVELAPPNLQLRWVMFGELIEEDPNILKHEIIPEANRKISDVTEKFPFLITAPPEEIQRVIIQNPDKIIKNDEGIIKLKRCPSVFSEKNIVFEKDLLGQWETEDRELIEFIRRGNNSYDIVSRDPNGKEQYSIAILYRLNGQTFLSVYESTPSKTDIDNKLILFPDSLLLVEYTKTQLNSWHIEREEIEAEDKHYNYGSLRLKDPYVLFKKNTKQYKDKK